MQASNSQVFHKTFPQKKKFAKFLTKQLRWSSILVKLQKECLCIQKMTPVIYTFLGILQNLSNNHTKAQLF